MLFKSTLIDERVEHDAICLKWCLPTHTHTPHRQPCWLAPPRHSFPEMFRCSGHDAALTSTLAERIRCLIYECLLLIKWLRWECAENHHHFRSPFGFLGGRGRVTESRKGALVEWQLVVKFYGFLWVGVAGMQFDVSSINTHLPHGWNFAVIISKLWATVCCGVKVGKVFKCF